MKSVGIFISMILALTVASPLRRIAANDDVREPRTPKRQKLRKVPSQRAELNLKEVAFKIVYETYRETEGRPNWELYLMNADGSNPINLTNTHDVDEMYPHASPDGTKICFVADEGAGRRKVRSVYYMKIDGTERFKVAGNARQPCWSSDSKKIAYLKGEYERYSDRPYATSDLIIYDLLGLLPPYTEVWSIAMQSWLLKPTVQSYSTWDGGELRAADPTLILMATKWCGGRPTGIYAWAMST